MKALITDLGNPKRTPEEIKESGRLFFNRGELNNDIALALVDNDVTTEGNIQLFFQEMGSNKDNYGYFIFNKITGEYIVYDFLLSIVDERLIDVEYVAKAICLPMMNRFQLNNPNMDSYIKVGEDCYKMVQHDNVSELEMNISKHICKQ